MADPTRYRPGFNYSGWEADHPTEPKPGAELDNDFAHIRHSIDETIRALRDVRRSDGKLNNAVVTFDALNPAVKAAISGSEFDYEVIEDLLAKDANLQDLPDKAEARENLGALGRDDNLSDLTNLKEARANLGTFSTVADVQASHIPAVLESIRTEGVAGADYRRKLAGEPDFPGDITSADGARWELDTVSPSVLHFGAVADGDGKGGGTDNSQAFQDGIDFAIAKKAVLSVPMLGTGVYRVDSKLTAGPLTIAFDEGATIDATNLKAGWNDQLLTFEGSFDGPEIPLGAAAQRDDWTLTTAQPHGLEVGDWFLLRGQRNAIHADAGPRWQLGIPTGSNLDTHACFFAEPCQVAEVISSTAVRLGRRIIFPDYLTDDSQETSPLARPTSTIQKIDFCERPTLVNPRILIDGTTAVKFILCRNHKIENGYCYAGEGKGSFVINTRSMNGRFKVECEHVPYQYMFENHYQYNSFKDESSWYTEWDYVDRHGMQGLDVTYVIGGEVSIAPIIRGKAYDNWEQGITFHPGCYGWHIESLTAIRPRWNAINTRSRFGSIGTVYAIANNYSYHAAVQLHQWAVDIQIGAIYSDGFTTALSIGAEVQTGGGLINRQAFRKNVSVGLVHAIRCRDGVYLVTHEAEDVPNTNPSGITIDQIKVDQFSRSALWVGQYVHGVHAKTITMTRPDSNDLEPVYFANNNIACRVDSVDGGGYTYTRLVRPPNLTDSTMFPDLSGTYLRLGLITNGMEAAGLGGTPAGYPVYTANHTLNALDAHAGVVWFNSATGRTLTVPGSNDIVPGYQEIVVYNQGAGTITLDGPIHSDKPLTLAQDEHIRLMRIGGNRWIAW